MIARSLVARQEVESAMEETNTITTGEVAGNAAPPRTVKRRDPRLVDGLLRAARRVLVRDGFARLSFKTVAREAGRYTTSVPYYFGNRAGLIAALVDSLAPKAFLDDVSAKASQVGDTQDRLEIQMQAWREMAEGHEGSQTLVELVPHVIRDPELRRTVGLLYRSYRDYDIGLLGIPAAVPPAEARALASILIAVNDGLAVHGLLDPDDVDFDMCYAVLTELFGVYLERLRMREAGIDRPS